MAESFVFYASFAEAMDELDNEQYGKLMRAINEYAIFDKWPKLTGVLKMLFTLIKPQIDANTVKRNSYLQDVENGKKGGRPERFTQEEKLQIALENHDGVPVGRIADEYKCSISLIYKVLNEVSDAELGNYINSLHLHKPVCVIPQTINDNANVNDNVNDIGTKAPEPSGSPAPKRTRFIKPSLADIKAYCAERENNVDPEKFINYYDSNGWHVGKNPMKDWRAAVRTWEKNNFQTSPPKNHGMDGDQSQQSKARALVESWKTGVYA
nr:MAG TPA: hypothetical protein [Caudoviricetes sp.]